MRLYDQDNNVAEQSFDEAVDHNLVAMEEMSVVGISAKAFELGEKLARFRNEFEIPGTESMAELKALYQVLLERFHQTYFSGHSRQNLEALQMSVTDKDTLDTKKRSSSQTPPDVRVMIDIYNAIWNIHYQEFLQDPIHTMANWDLDDPYQTRAIRAVLHDIPYKDSLMVACMMVYAVQDTPKDHIDYVTVAAKQELVNGIICHREETPAVVAHRLRRGNMVERGLVLKTLIMGLSSESEQPGKLNNDNTVVPMAKNS